MDEVIRDLTCFEDITDWNIKQNIEKQDYQTDRQDGYKHHGVSRINFESIQNLFL